MPLPQLLKQHLRRLRRGENDENERFLFRVLQTRLETVPLSLANVQVMVDAQVRVVVEAHCFKAGLEAVAIFSVLVHDVDAGDAQFRQ